MSGSDDNEAIEASMIAIACSWSACAIGARVHASGESAAGERSFACAILTQDAVLLPTYLCPRCLLVAQRKSATP